MLGKKTVEYEIEGSFKDGISGEVGKMRAKVDSDTKKLGGSFDEFESETTKSFAKLRNEFFGFRSIFNAALASISFASLFQQLGVFDAIANAFKSMIDTIKRVYSEFAVNTSDGFQKMKDAAIRSAQAIVREFSATKGPLGDVKESIQDLVGVQANAFLRINQIKKGLVKLSERDAQDEIFRLQTEANRARVLIEKLKEIEGRIISDAGFKSDTNLALALAETDREAERKKFSALPQRGALGTPETIPFSQKAQSSIGRELDQAVSIGNEYARVFGSEVPTANQLAVDSMNTLSAGVASSFTRIGAALVNGGNGLKAFAKAIKASLGEIAASFGQVLIKMAVPFFIPGPLFNPGAGLAYLAAGAALSILGGALGASGARSGGSRGGSFNTSDRSFGESPSSQTREPSNIINVTFTNTVGLSGEAIKEVGQLVGNEIIKQTKLKRLNFG